MYQVRGWEKDLETGIALLDQQHKTFMKHANQFVLRLRANRNQEEQAVKDEIAFLQQYILSHFQAEEAFMTDCDYAEFRMHQAEHKQLSFQVKAITTKMMADLSEASIMEFCNFIDAWLCSHIMKFDLEFARCYRAGQQET